MADRLRGLQALRALAAAMVLAGHAIAEAEHYTGIPLAAGALPWTRGVDLFFVASGLLIAVSTRDLWAAPGGAGTFLVRRAIRVVPPYWLFTTLMLAVLVTAPGAAKDTTLDAGQAVSSYLFLPYARADGRIAPILSLGWTLNYEILFYGIVALALPLRRGPGLAAVVGALAALVAIGLLVRPEGTVARTWTNPIILEFAGGLLLAEAQAAWGRRIAPSLGRGALAVGVGLALLVALDRVPGLPRVVAAGLPAALVVAGPALWWRGAADARVPGALVALGDASFALYLSHRFVLRLATILLLPVLPAGVAGAWTYVAVVAVAALAASLIVHRAIERPMLAALRRRTRTRAPRETAPA